MPKRHARFGYSPMDIKHLNRRQFMIALGWVGTLPFDAPIQGIDYSPTLHNTNWQTAIGLGDEPASIVDRFGQLKSDDVNGPELANVAKGGGSRNVTVQIEVGRPAHPVSSLGALQWLEDGYLPIVHTKVSTKLGLFQSVIFSSDSGDLKADYVGIKAGRNPFRVKLLCTTTTLISANEGVVRTPNQILAVAPVPTRVRIHNAGYNCVNSERNTRVFPSAVAWEGSPR